MRSTAVKVSDDRAGFLHVLKKRVEFTVGRSFIRASRTHNRDRDSYYARRCVEFEIVV